MPRQKGDAVHRRRLRPTSISKKLKSAKRAKISHKGRTIFLAETTADLRADRDSLRRELMEMGHRVLPEGALPFDRDELEAAVRKYLDQCEITVHLVGSRYGLIPEGTQESMVELQNRWAGAHARSGRIRRLIWIPPSQAPREDRQERFIHSLRVDPEFQLGAEVIEGPLSSLKQLALQRLKPAEPPPLAAPSNAASHPPHVYLLYDRIDESDAAALQDWLFERGMEVSIPDHGAEEEEAGRFHRETLCACDAVIVFFGEVRRSWVETKLRDLLKAPGFGRTTAFGVKAVYATPGGDFQKQRFKTHLADVIAAQSRFDATALGPLVDRIKAGGISTNRGPCLDPSLTSAENTSSKSSFSRAPVVTFWNSISMIPRPRRTCWRSGRRTLRHRY